MQENNNSFFDNFDFFPFESDAAVCNEYGVFLDCKAFESLCYNAFERLSFTFTKEHLENIIKSCLSPDASENDKYVLSCILKNAQAASGKKFALCQDTGIANIFGWSKGSFFTVEKSESLYDAVSNGTKNLYHNKNLRFSTTCPVSFYDEKDPKNNMPPQISFFKENCCLAPEPSFLKNSPGDSMNLIFCAKGGGSSNKTVFFQGTKANLTEKGILDFIEQKISGFGVSACPPYTVCIVVGGLSPEQNLLTLKLATTGAYDTMTYTPNPNGFRDKFLEQQVINIAKNTGFGSQFGGTQFVLDAVVIRLPRHGASCPISAGVSCCAHRNLKAVITKDGYFLEKTVSEPEKLEGFEKCVSISNMPENAKSAVLNTDSGIENLLKKLNEFSVGDRILLSGKILIARDQAHARWLKLIESGQELPEYTKKYPVFYAGPARTPEGEVTGSIGPTTAGRMDSYGEIFMKNGASLITLAKGNRSSFWKECCKKFGGFYLGTPGGIAALNASKYVLSQKIIDYEDLGMEAVRIVEVKNLPCFLLTDNKGNDFYESL